MNLGVGIGCLVLGMLGPVAGSFAGQPCDRYPKQDQPRCEKLWKEINAEAEGEVSRFGLDQLQRRREGKISQEQHLQENTAFIKRSAARRLERLAERMAQR